MDAGVAAGGTAGTQAREPGGPGPRPSATTPRERRFECLRLQQKQRKKKAKKVGKAQRSVC